MFVYHCKLIKYEWWEYISSVLFLSILYNRVSRNKNATQNNSFLGTRVEVCVCVCVYVCICRVVDLCICVCMYLCTYVKYRIKHRAVKTYYRTWMYIPGHLKFSTAGEHVLNLCRCKDCWKLGVNVTGLDVAARKKVLALDGKLK